MKRGTGKTPFKNLVEFRDKVRPAVKRHVFRHLNKFPREVTRGAGCPQLVRKLGVTWRISVNRRSSMVAAVQVGLRSKEGDQIPGLHRVEYHLKVPVARIDRYCRGLVFPDEEPAVGRPHEKRGCAPFHVAERKTGFCERGVNRAVLGDGFVEFVGKCSSRLVANGELHRYHGRDAGSNKGLSRSGKWIRERCPRAVARIQDYQSRRPAVAEQVGQQSAVDRPGPPLLVLQKQLTVVCFAVVGAVPYEVKNMICSAAQLPSQSGLCRLLERANLSQSLQP